MPSRLWTRVRATTGSLVAFAIILFVYDRRGQGRFWPLGRRRTPVQRAADRLRRRR